jgi:hypothetical protein
MTLLDFFNPSGAILTDDENDASSEKRRSAAGGFDSGAWHRPWRRRPRSRRLPLSPDLEFAGDTAWMLTSTALVLFMTIPGLSLFYAGMVRAKNVLSVMMQCFAITALITVLWALYGYSLAFDATGMDQGSHQSVHFHRRSRQGVLGVESAGIA